MKTFVLWLLLLGVLVVHARRIDQAENEADGAIMPELTERDTFGDVNKGELEKRAEEQEYNIPLDINRAKGSFKRNRRWLWHHPRHVHHHHHHHYHHHRHYHYHGR